MKVLLTGATGFIGKRVLNKLQQRNIDFVILTSGMVEGVSTIPALHYQYDENYLCSNGCEDVDALVHLGAWTPKANKDVNSIEDAYGNIANTKILLRSNLPNLKKIIYGSTLDVYQNIDGEIAESTPTIPATMYGWSKLYCEKMVQAFCKENNLISQVLRIGHVYGEGEEKYRKVMPIMIEDVIKGNDLQIYGDGEAIRTFIYIDDVAEAIVNALELNESETINIVGNEPITINQLAKLIQKISKSNVGIEHIPTEMENRNCIFDNYKLKNTLLDKFIPFEIGLQREMDYMEKKINNELHI